jgi:anaphase-promoting complex subunit 5
MTAASHLLQHLTAGILFDSELRYHRALLEISYHLRLRSFPAASDLIEDLALKLRDTGADIYMRIHLLSLKSQLWAKAGQPEKALSIAIRAASMASRFQIAPALWEAIGSIANVLVHLREYDAARQLGDAVIPQSLEGGDLELCARLYSTQADAYMGLAGAQMESSERNRTRYINQAELHIDRAGECKLLSQRISADSLQDSAD